VTRLLITLVLVARFAKAVLFSAWATAWLILTASDAPRRGLVRMGYGDLRDTGVVVLAAMVTLTPGTSVVDIDSERSELLLHMLDTADIEATIAQLQREFLEPIRNLFGARS
jgi:multisubunit Na+/H+ antiporter MnhE subunit